MDGGPDDWSSPLPDQVSDVTSFSSKTCSASYCELGALVFLIKDNNL